MSRSVRSTLLVLLSLATALLLAPAALAAATPTLPPSPAIPQGAEPAISAAVGGSAAHASAIPALTFISASAATKLAPTGGVNGDEIGWDVAVSGSVIAVGAPTHSSGGVLASGAVYIFTRLNGVWTQTQELALADGQAHDLFGWSLDLQGGTLVVGAPGRIGDASRSGAVYVYKNIAGVWTAQQELSVPVSATSSALGESVDLDGDQLIAGADGFWLSAPGAAYIFTRSSGVWSQSADLVPSADSDPLNMGYAVALSGDTAMAGSWTAGDFEGRVWVFTRSGSTWSQTQVISGPVGKRGQYGGNLIVNGDTAFVTANSETIGVNEWQGAVHVLKRTGSAWSEVQLLTLDGGVAYEEFGFGTSLSGSALLVTTLGADFTAGTWSGKGYVYVDKGGTWERQSPVLKADDVPATAIFGYAAALDGGAAVIGAPNNSSASPGAAYTYDLTALVTPTVAGGHGSVSPATAQAVPLGGALTFTFTPETGYLVDAILVDGGEVAMHGLDQYVFAPIYVDHALSVSFYNAAGPATTISGARDWSRRPVHLKFSATPATDGKPVAYTEYKIGEAAWKKGVAKTISRQGQTRVWARSVDTRGNIGANAVAAVGIDSTRPVVTGYGRPTGWTGGDTRFRFKVKDAATGTVHAVLVVTRYHVPIRQYDLGDVPTGKAVTRRAALGLGVGTWSWRIMVRDHAGNRGLGSWRFLDVLP
jgi:hypothetical protein